MAARAKEYASKAYWEKRFGTENAFEWLQGFDAISGPLTGLLEEKSTEAGKTREQLRILVIGCGTSSLSASLYDVGWKSITNVDFSEVLIEKMRETHAQERPLMRWIAADCRDMNSIESGSFDVVLDKATLDAISCGGEEAVRRTTDEVWRVLEAGGLFLLLSYSRFRMEDFLGEDNVDRDTRTGEDPKWKCDRCLGLISPDHDDNGSVSAPSNQHYLYILRSKAPAS
eukprot:TRINITY_DN9785_c0_g1_i1.p1 TRINITY_DN9785_c0_g1~~TRINITY_DN9785_c0_g1_i1.p1  ORF type:complete len:228 (+),score=84.72 TRINITY_DN9785_c0_g1_i1:101-784(+)